LQVAQDGFSERFRNRKIDNKGKRSASFCPHKEARKARVKFVYDAGETPALHTQRVYETTLTEKEVDLNETKD